MLTSKELSEKIKKAGFEEESKKAWCYHYQAEKGRKVWSICDYDEDDKVNTQIKAFDILNDLCVKYAEEVFGEEPVILIDRIEPSFIACPEEILRMLQQNKPQKAIEDYIVANSILFKSDIECIRCNDNGCPDCEDIKFNIKD